MHVHIGDNYHSFRERQCFWKYTPEESTIQQVSISLGQVRGMGVYPISINKSNSIIFLYLCYHILNSSEDTLELTTIKFYEKMRLIWLETLPRLKLIFEYVAYFDNSITPYKELFDYVRVNIIYPTIIAIISHTPITLHHSHWIIPNTLTRHTLTLGKRHNSSP